MGSRCFFSTVPRSAKVRYAVFMRGTLLSFDLFLSIITQSEEKVDNQKEIFLKGAFAVFVSPKILFLRPEGKGAAGAPSEKKARIVFFSVRLF